MQLTMRLLGLCMLILLVLPIALGVRTDSVKEISSVSRLVGDSAFDIINQLDSKQLDLEHATRLSDLKSKDTFNVGMLEYGFFEKNNLYSGINLEGGGNPCVSGFEFSCWRGYNHISSDLDQFEANELFFLDTSIDSDMGVHSHKNDKIYPSDVENWKSKFAEVNPLLLLNIDNAGLALPHEKNYVNALTRYSNIIAPKAMRSSEFGTSFLCNLQNDQKLGDIFRRSRSKYYSTITPSQENLPGLVLKSYSLYGNPLTRIKVPQDYSNYIKKERNSCDGYYVAPEDYHYEQLDQSNDTLSVFRNNLNFNYDVINVSNSSYDLLNSSELEYDYDNPDLVGLYTLRTHRLPKGSNVGEVEFTFSNPTYFLLSNYPSFSESGLVDRSCFDLTQNSTISYGVMEFDMYDEVTLFINPIEVTDCLDGSITAFKSVQYQLEYEPSNSFYFDNLVAPSVIVPGSTSSVSFDFKYVTGDDLGGNILLVKDGVVVFEEEIIGRPQNYTIQFMSEEEGYAQYDVQYLVNGDIQQIINFDVDVKNIDVEILIGKFDSGTVGVDLFINNLRGELLDVSISAEIVNERDVYSGDVQLQTGSNLVSFLISDLLQEDESYPLVLYIEYLGKRMVISDLISVNHKPVIKSDGILVRSGDTVNFTNYVYDLDDSLLQISTDYGLEWITNDSYIGEHNVTIIVSDEVTTVSDIVKVNVIQSNFEPNLSSVEDFIVVEGELVGFQLVGFDIDGDDLNFSVYDSDFIKIDEDWFEWVTDVGDEGNYTVYYSVNDGKSETEKSFNVEVLDSNSSYDGVDNHAPLLDAINNQLIYEGDEITVIVVGSDLDSDLLNYSINDTRFSQESDEFIWQTQAGDAGKYSFKVYVTDGEFIVGEDFIVYVLSMNETGIIKSINYSNELYEGQPLNMTVVFENDYIDELDVNVETQLLKNGEVVASYTTNDVLVSVDSLNSPSVSGISTLNYVTSLNEGNSDLNFTASSSHVRSLTVPSSARVLKAKMSLRGKESYVPDVRECSSAESCKNDWILDDYKIVQITNPVADQGGASVSTENENLILYAYTSGDSWQQDRRAMIETENLMLQGFQEIIVNGSSYARASGAGHGWANAVVSVGLTDGQNSVGVSYQSGWYNEHESGQDLIIKRLSRNSASFTLNGQLSEVKDISYLDRLKDWQMYFHVHGGSNNPHDQGSFGRYVIKDIVYNLPDSDSDAIPDFIDDCSNTPLGILIDDYGCPIMSYPSDVGVDIGNDGVVDYSYIGELDGRAYMELKSQVQSYLDGCEGECSIPMSFSSNSLGLMEYSNLDVIYDTGESSLGSNSLEVFSNGNNATFGSAEDIVKVLRLPYNAEITDASVKVHGYKAFVPNGLNCVGANECGHVWNSSDYNVTSYTPPVADMGGAFVYEDGGYLHLGAYRSGESAQTNRHAHINTLNLDLRGFSEIIVNGTSYAYTTGIWHGAATATIAVGITDGRNHVGTSYRSGHYNEHKSAGNLVITKTGSDVRFILEGRSDEIKDITSLDPTKAWNLYFQANGGSANPHEQGGYSKYSVGNISYNIPDVDGDTTPDDYDSCPNTPIGAMVDENGCPLESEPSNLWLDSGDDGLDWTYSGTFVGGDVSIGLEEGVKSYLETCDYDDKGYCYIPIRIHSDSVGTITSKLDVKYNWNSGGVNLFIKEDFNEEGNLTFTGSQDHVRNVVLPKDANVLDATFKIKGYRDLIPGSNSGVVIPDRIRDDFSSDTLSNTCHEEPMPKYKVCENDKFRYETRRNSVSGVSRTPVIVDGKYFLNLQAGWLITNGPGDTTLTDKMNYRNHDFTVSTNADFSCDSLGGSHGYRGGRVEFFINGVSVGGYSGAAHYDTSWTCKSLSLTGVVDYKTINANTGEVSYNGGDPIIISLNPEDEVKLKIKTYATTKNDYVSTMKFYMDPILYKPTDLDSDGVADDVDQCVEDPNGFSVGVDGCHVFSYPSNIKVDVDGDGIRDWSHLGEFSGEETTSELGSAFSSYLSSCAADEEGNCNVPVVIHSDTRGTLIDSDLSIIYADANVSYATQFNNGAFGDVGTDTIYIEFPVNVNISLAKINLKKAGGQSAAINPKLKVNGEVVWSGVDGRSKDFSRNINSYLSTCLEDCNVPFEFSVDSGLIEYSDINIVYTTIDYESSNEYEFSFIWPLSTGFGEYELRTIADYGLGNDVVDGDVEITNVPPVLIPINDFIQDEGTNVHIVANAFDVVDNPLLFEINDSRFKQSGNIFTWESEYSDQGVHNFRVSVRDGDLVVYDEISVTLNDINSAPNLDISDSVIVDEGGEVIIPLSATDVDGDPLTFSIDDERFTLVNDSFVWSSDLGDGGECNTVSVQDVQRTNYLANEQESWKCTQVGYDNCDAFRYCEDGYCSQTRVASTWTTKPQKYCPKLNARYYAKSFTSKYNIDADKAYLLNPYQPSGCNDLGCNSPSHIKTIDDSGDAVIVTAPAKGIPSFGYAAWENGRKWANQNVKYEARPDLYVLDCCSDNDCASTEICDTIGGYQDFKCKEDRCLTLTCGNKCDGNIRSYSGSCSREKQDCVYSTENCGTDGWYCNGDVKEYKDYGCQPDSCTAVVASSYDCNNNDGYYCNGNYLEYHEYGCGSGDCKYTTTQRNNCNNEDGWYCDGNDRSFRDYGCVTDDCKYMESNRESCIYGCSNGYCNLDPCSQVSCGNYCEGDTRYFNTGCNSGKCGFDSEVCEFGCNAGECIEDPCVGVSCNNKCTETLRQFNGTCDQGTCRYKSEDCGFGCNTESCNSDPCSGVNCDDYCDGYTKYYSGNCSSGDCGYQKEFNSKDCGYDPCIKDYEVTVTVDDGLATVSKKVMVKVRNINHGPEILGLVASNVSELDTVTIQIDADDVDNDNLFYSINQPGFVVVNNELLWETEIGDAGLYTFTVGVSDGEFDDFADVTVNISETHLPPVILDIPNVTADETENVTINVFAYSASDYSKLGYGFNNFDGNKLDYSVNDSRFSIENNVLTWQTDNDDAGEHNVLVTVNDGELSSSKNVLVVINNVNRRPSPPTHLTPMTGVFDQGVDEVCLGANDGDGDPLVYFVEAFVNGDWTQSLNFSDVVNQDVDLRCKVSDGDLESEWFNPPGYITIFHDADNDGVTDIDDLCVGSTEDVNKEGCGCSQLEVDDGNICTDDLCSSGVVSYVNNTNLVEEISDCNTDVCSGEQWLDYRDDGYGQCNNGDVVEYVCSVVSSYSSVCDLDDDNDTILDVDDCEPNNAEIYPDNLDLSKNCINDAPVLQNISDITVDENETIILIVSAQDPDEDDLTITYSGAMTSNSWQTTYDDSGDYVVTVTVSDGELEVNQDVNVLVNNIVRSNYGGTDFSTIDDIENVVNLTLEAVEGSIVFSEVVNLSGVEDISSIVIIEQNKVIVDTSKLPAINVPATLEMNVAFEEMPNIYMDGELCSICSNVVLVDGKLTFDVTHFTEFEARENHPPVLTLVDQVVNELDALTYQVKADDEDGNSLFYYDDSDEFDINSDGLIVWKTTEEDVGGYDVKITVSDGKLNVSDVFKIHVKNVNQAPDVDENVDFSVDENELAVISVIASDHDNDPLELSVNDTRFKQIDNQFGWQTTYDDAGEYHVLVSVSDGNETVSQNVNVVVNHVNRAPVLEAIDDVVVDETDVVTLNAVGSDPDNDLLTYFINDTRFKRVESVSGAVYEWITTYDDSGLYDVLVTVADGKLEASENVKVTVNHVNRKPLPPTGISPSNGIFDDSIEIQCSGGLDPDDDTISYILQVKISDTWQDIGENSVVFDTSSLDNQDVYLRCATDDGNLVSDWYMNDDFVTIFHDKDKDGVTDQLDLCSDSPKSDIATLYSENWELNEVSRYNKRGNGNDLMWDSDGVLFKMFRGQSGSFNHKIDELDNFFPTTSNFVLGYDFTITDFPGTDGEGNMYGFSSVDEAGKGSPVVGGHGLQPSLKSMIGCTYGGDKSDNLIRLMYTSEDGRDITSDVAFNEISEEIKYKTKITGENGVIKLELFDELGDQLGQEVSIDISGEDISEAFNIESFMGHTDPGISGSYCAITYDDISFSMVDSEGYVNEQGCSCSQLIVDDGNICTDDFCSSGIFSYKNNEELSPDITSCSVDRCVGENFYDYPDNGYAQCANGGLQSYSCDPTITYNSTCDVDDDNDGDPDVTDCGPDDPDVYHGNSNLLNNCVNDAPVFGDWPTLYEVDEGERVQLDAIATDPDQDGLKYEINDTRFMQGYYVFWWDPNYGDSGEHNFKVITTDDMGLSTTKNLKIVVNDVNRAPKLDQHSPEFNYVGRENSTIVFSALYLDPDGDEVEYKWNFDGDLIAENKDIVEIYFNYESDGRHVLEVVASDGEFVVNDTWDINIKHKNRIPVVDEIGNQVVSEMDLVKIKVNGSDADGQGLQISVNDSRFVKRSWDEFDWQTNYESEGEYNFLVTILDSETYVYRKFSVKVDGLNRAPELEAIVDKEVNETELLMFTFKVSDADGDALIVSGVNLPEGALVTENKQVFAQSSGGSTETEYLFYWKPTYEQSGDYKIEIVVDDGKLEDKTGFEVAVNHVNRAPELEAIADVVVDEDELLMFTFKVSDVDGDALTVNGVNLPEGALVTENKEVSVQSIGGSTETEYLFYWKPTYEQSGDYKIEIVVDDGKLEDKTGFEVVVNNVNRVPGLETIADVIVDEANTVTLLPSASDPDGDALKFRINDSRFVQKGDTFSWLTGYDDSGVYNVQVTVGDGKLEASEDVEVTVNHVNRVPEVEAISDQEVNESELLMFTFKVSDADGDALTVNGVNLPDGALVSENKEVFVQSIAGSTETEYLFYWKPTYEQSGDYKIEVVVSDGKLEDKTGFEVVVNHVNRAPELEAIADIVVDEANTVTILPSASDPDGDALKFKINDSRFVQKGDTFSWLTGYDDSGVYNVQVTVSDGKLEANENVKVTVNHVNRGPGLEIELLNTEIELSDPFLTGSWEELDNDNMVDVFDDHVVIRDYRPIVMKDDGIMTDVSMDSSSWDWYVDWMQVDGRSCSVHQPSYAFLTGKEKGDLISPDDSVGVFVYEDGDTSPNCPGSGLALIARYNAKGDYCLYDKFSSDYDDKQRVQYNVWFNETDGKLYTWDSIDNDVESFLLVDSSNEACPQNNVEALAFFKGLKTMGQVGSGHGVPNGYDTRDHYIYNMSLAVEKYTGVSYDDGIIVLDETETITLAAVGHDLDGDSLTYSINDSRFGQIGNVFTWSTGYFDSGEYNVRITANDGSLEVSKDLVVKVNNVNRAPEVEGIPDQEIDENKLLMFTFNVGDADGDDLTVNGVNLLEGALVSENRQYFTQSTGESSTKKQYLFYWKPTYEQSGEYKIEMVVSDGKLEDKTGFEVVVNNVNRDFTVEDIKSVVVNEGDLVVVEVVANDPDGDVLSFVVDDKRFNGLEWQSGKGDAGLYSFNIKVSDGEFTHSKEAVVKVKDRNEKPIVKQISSVSAMEGEMITFSVDASDGDGDTLSYGIDNIEFDVKENVFSWKAKTGEYKFEVTVSDGSDKVSSNVNVDVLPSYCSKVKCESYCVGNTYVSATCSNDVIFRTNSYGGYGVEEWISIDRGDGLERFTYWQQVTAQCKTLKRIMDTPDGKKVYNYDADGIILDYLGDCSSLFYYKKSSDVDLSTKQTYEFSSTNREKVKGCDYRKYSSSPQCVKRNNKAPVIGEIANVTIDEGGVVTIVVEASDYENTPLSYRINDGRFKQEANVFTWQTDNNVAGEYVLTVTVVDAIAGVVNYEIEKDVYVTVNDVACGGVLCSNYCSGTTRYYNAKCILETETCGYDVQYNADQCGYVNNDPLIDSIEPVVVDETGLAMFEVVALEDGVRLVVNDERFSQDGSAFSWQTDYTSAGVFEVEVIASKDGRVDSKIVDVTVMNKNRGPAFVGSVPDSVIMYEDVPVSLNISGMFNDPDGDELSYHTNTNDVSVELIDANTLEIHSVENYFGDSQIKIIADDGVDTENSESFILSVVNTPEISPLNVVVEQYEYKADDEISFDFSINDTMAMSNCSLVVDGEVVGSKFGMNKYKYFAFPYDDRGRDDYFKIGWYRSTVEKSFYSVNLIYGLELDVGYYASHPSDKQIEIMINDVNVYNVSREQVESSCGRNKNCLVTVLFDDVLSIYGDATVTLSSSYSFADHFRVGVDKDTNLGRSGNTKQGIIEGEYIIRLVGGSDFIRFKEQLDRGSHSWYGECYNVDNSYKKTDTYSLTVVNSVPTYPSSVLPESGTFSNSIDVECSGSYDGDNDPLTYTMWYKRGDIRLSEWEILEEDGDGFATLDVSEMDGASLRLRCMANDGITNSPTKDVGWIKVKN